MLIRALLLVFIFCVACRTHEYSGIKEIKCPEFKAKKLRKNYHAFRVRTPKKSERTVSAKNKKDQSMFKTRIEHLHTTTDENFDLKPILHQVNVEDLDCPKPGMGKNLPKAVKQNIRRNNKKIRSYLKNRTEVDSVRAASFPAPKK
jgi:hypothetical protein